ncbi:hypothetical protein ACLESO_25555 [Pyxidicoccus sp. 3LG]
MAHGRYLLADIFEQSLPTWLRLHMEDCEHRGGVVEGGRTT